MLKKSAIIFMLIMMVASVSVFAGENKAKSSGEELTIEGKLVCMGCSLKKAEGARSACSTNGCSNALKTKDGKYISFLENQYSEGLMKGEKYNNKEMKVTGTYYANANVIDVKSFTVEGKKKVWCGHCKSMDGCMSASK